MPLPKSTRLLFLDTLPVLRLLEFHPEYYPPLSALLDTVYERRIQMITSPVTLMEASTQAFRKDQAFLAQQYREFFTRSKHLQVREIDAPIAMEAARLRALHSLDCGTSLQLATAIHSGADLVLAGDPRWKNWCDLEILTLEDLLS